MNGKNKIFKANRKSNLTSVFELQFCIQILKLLFDKLALVFLCNIFSSVLQELALLLNSVYLNT